jgi:hypothetical protein
LRPESCSVDLGGRRIIRKKNSAAIAPIHPCVPNAGTVLRGGCGNGVGRTGHPGERLR